MEDRYDESVEAPHAGPANPEKVSSIEQHHYDYTHQSENAQTSDEVESSELEHKHQFLQSNDAYTRQQETPWQQEEVRPEWHAGQHGDLQVGASGQQPQKQEQHSFNEYNAEWYGQQAARAWGADHPGNGTGPGPSFAQTQQQSDQISYPPLPQFSQHAQQQPQSQLETHYASGSRAPHPIVAFGFGGRCAVIFPRRQKPISTAFGEQQPYSGQASSEKAQLLHTSKLLSRESWVQSMQRFPGPLGHAEQAGSIQHFIDQQVAIGASTGMQRSEQLLWSLLKEFVMFRGSFNGMTTGLADLLLRYEVPTTTAVLNAAALQPNSEIMQQGALEMQRLLLRGDHERACHVAMESQLWGPALLLSSFMDVDKYKQVMGLFSSQFFEDGSPLKTMYTLYSGQADAIFHRAEQPGGLVHNWKQNLAVMLANRTPNDLPIIVRLADMVRQRYSASDAHFGYLAVDVPVLPLDHPQARMCLVGSDIRAGPSNFVEPEAFQKTEIWYYAKKLGSSKFALPHFLVYKMLYAAQLADVGMVCFYSIDLRVPSGLLALFEYKRFSAAGG
jgi:hypothetical protein